MGIESGGSKGSSGAEAEGLKTILRLGRRLPMTANIEQFNYYSQSLTAIFFVKDCNLSSSIRSRKSEFSRSCERSSAGIRREGTILLPFNGLSVNKETVVRISPQAQKRKHEMDPVSSSQTLISSSAENLKRIDNDEKNLNCSHRQPLNHYKPETTHISISLRRIFGKEKLIDFLFERSHHDLRILPNSLLFCVNF